MKAADFLPLSADLMAYSHRIGRVAEDPHLRKLADFAATHEYANMNSSLEQVMLIQLLARQSKAKVVVEVGVYLGLTTLALAQCIPPGGTVIALEAHEPFVDLARPYWSSAGMSEKIDVRIGPALASMQAMDDGQADLIYIDCNKPQYVDYVREAIRIVRCNGLVLVDNTLWKGNVLDMNDTSENTVGIRAVNEMIRNLDPKLFKIVNLPIGDGLTMILKLASPASGHEIATHSASDLDQTEWHALTARGIPFLVSGIQHPAAEKWTEEYLSCVAHDEAVTLTTRKEFDESRQISWKEAISEISKARSVNQGSLYLQQTHPPGALESDIAIPRFFPRHNHWERGMINVWISQASPAGSRTVAHYDPLDNLLCVVSGEKHVKLWSPSVSSILFETTSSRTSFASIDSCNFNRHFQQSLARRNLTHERMLRLSSLSRKRKIAVESTLIWSMSPRPLIRILSLPIGRVPLEQESLSVFHRIGSIPSRQLQDFALQSTFGFALPSDLMPMLSAKRKRYWPKWKSFLRAPQRRNSQASALRNSPWFCKRPAIAD